MIPSFLRPERIPYASVEIISDVTYLLHVRHPRGTEQTMAFTSASSRALALIALVKQPVDLRTSEVTS